MIVAPDLWSLPALEAGSFKRLIKPTYLHFKDEIAKRKAKHKVRYLLRTQKEILLEIGSGRRGLDGWIAIDIKKKGDICWDLRNGIPFPDESVSQLYSSHFFEHLSFKEGQRFLDECLRVLRPGGKFSIFGAFVIGIPKIFMIIGHLLRTYKVGINIVANKFIGKNTEDFFYDRVFYFHCSKLPFIDGVADQNLSV